MSPVDAIRPPKKSKKISAPSKPMSLPIVVKKKAIASPKFSNKEQKNKLMWLLAAIVTGIVFIGWIWLFQNGLITNSSSNQSGFFEQIGDKVSGLWQTIKTDILNIKKTEENKNTNSEEEKIKELEKKVFPQFTDPSKQ